MVSLVDKLETLGPAAAFDVATAAERLGTQRSRHPLAGCFYPSKVSGDVVWQFKALLSNACSLRCKYCFTTCAQRKYSLTPEEYAAAFAKAYAERRVDALFISSAVAGDPDATTERMLEAVRLVREKYLFGGHVHFKVLPGVSRHLVERAAQLADRLSVNLEAPTSGHLAEIAPDKDFNSDLLKRLDWASQVAASGWLKSGITTQLVVGAAGETDVDVLKRAAWFYGKRGARRFYYSAFRPIPGSELSDRPATGPDREARLYQADHLLRVYGFGLEELLSIVDDLGFLPAGDPKQHLAGQFFDRGEKVDVNEAPVDLLLRVPGIGPKSAANIARARERGVFFNKAKDLLAVGVCASKALPYLKLGGPTVVPLTHFLHPSASHA
ncbi:MAG: radical SAM protein [Promethearchaeota archaeon]